MKTIIIVASDSIRALFHQRLLVGLMLASLAVTLFFSIILSSARRNITGSYEAESTATNSADTGKSTVSTNGMSQADQKRMQETMEEASSYIQAFFYQVASFGGSLVALFIFSTAVVAEIRKGTIRLTLSKPVSRTQFFLGKYLGGVAVMAAYAVIVSIAMLIFAGAQNVELSPAIKWAPWLMFWRQLMLGSVAMLLSLLVHPIIASVIAFVAGNGLCQPPNPFYYLLPSYKDFNVFFQVVHGTLISSKDVGFLTLYAVDFVILMLLLAVWRFRTKELV